MNIRRLGVAVWVSICSHKQVKIPFIVRRPRQGGLSRRCFFREPSQNLIIQVLQIFIRRRVSHLLGIGSDCRHGRAEQRMECSVAIWLSLSWLCSDVTVGKIGEAPSAYTLRRIVAKLLHQSRPYSFTGALLTACQAGPMTQHLHDQV